MSEAQEHADIMRSAASLLLERADAMDAEFKTNAYWGWSSAEGDAEVFRRGVAGGLGGASGELAAPWHPEANRAVARWLQITAADLDVWGKDVGGFWAYALDAARHYLGEAAA